MKKIICILHGLTDSPLQDLGGITPLEKANCHYLDTMAKKGECLAVIPPKFGGFETAFLNMLGIQDNLDTIAQGPLEAYSLGYVLTPNQVAFSVRFISMGEDVIIDVSDSLLTADEGKLLSRDLNKELGKSGCHFFHLRDSRAVLVSEHPAFCRAINQCYRNPLEALGKRWDDVLPGGKKDHAMYSLVKKISSVLSKHEINGLKMDLEEPLVNSIMVFNGGAKPKLSSLPVELDPSRIQIYTTSSASLGVARMLGISAFQWPSEQKKYEHLITLLGKLEEIFSQKDVLIIEVHHLWKSTYNGELLEKVKGIEWLDRYVVKHLMNFCSSNDCQLTVLPLKQTNIRGAELLPGPVPAVLFSGKHKRENQIAFSEEMVNQTSKQVLLSNLLNT